MRLVGNLWADAEDQQVAASEASRRHRVELQRAGGDVVKRQLL